MGHAAHQGLRGEGLGGRHQQLDGARRVREQRVVVGQRDVRGRDHFACNTTLITVTRAGPSGIDSKVSHGIDSELSQYRSID